MNPWMRSSTLMRIWTTYVNPRHIVIFYDPGTDIRQFGAGQDGNWVDDDEDDDDEGGPQCAQQ